MLAAMSLFWGPQMLRNDLRQDLPATDVLKMFPMPGWQVVLGEVLAPAAILAGAQWLLLLVGFDFLSKPLRRPFHLAGRSGSVLRWPRRSCCRASI